MRYVDELMTECPLKHEIRTNLWLPYVYRLKKKPIRYLTLYSPPLMDVKFFSKHKYINESDEHYENVVGVTNDPAAVIDEIPKRLELLIQGNINDLLTATKKRGAVKQLFDSFPFDAINLDYTDVLHKKGLTNEISPHLQAIDEILRLQTTLNKFVLFITTRVNINEYDDPFIENLKSLFDENISDTPNFSNQFNKFYDYKTAEDFCKKQPDNFFVLSLNKYLLRFLDDHRYDLKHGDIRIIQRDNKPPKRNLLHIAYHLEKIKPLKTTSKNNIGKRMGITVEHKSVDFIKKTYTTYVESNDSERLRKKHSKEIKELIQETFEISPPESTY